MRALIDAHWRTSRVTFIGLRYTVVTATSISVTAVIVTATNSPLL
jgi:hypothetical protein